MLLFGDALPRSNHLKQDNFNDDFAGMSLRREADRRVYPDWNLAVSDLLTPRLLLQYLHDGGRVWLMPEAKVLHSFVQTRRLLPFWGNLWFPDNTSTVMGMIIHDHSVLGQFPHDGCSDWQWYRLVNDTPRSALILCRPFSQLLKWWITSIVPGACVFFKLRSGAGRWLCLHGGSIIL